MGVKISELTEAMAAQNSDEMPIVQNGETKRINVENLFADLQSQITDLQNQINDKNAITTSASSSITLSTTGEQQIAITGAKAQVGNRLTISSNRIYIGSNISKVLVSCNVYLNLVANRGGVLNVQIRKNGTGITGLVNGGYASTATRNATIPVAPALIPVTEGDYIDYTVYGYAGDVIRCDNAFTYLTVEEID